MKSGIHPEYKETAISCSCGASYQTRSTKEHLSVEICSACHPFFTGEKRHVDTAGRIERFKQRYKNK